MKCDRQLPCTSCFQRNEATCCVHARNLEGLQSEHRHRLQAEARLEHLEQLVQELSQSRDIDAHQGRLTSGANTVQRGNDETPYDCLHNGATHWPAMLEDIEELRTAIIEHDDLDGVGRDLGSHEDDATSPLFGAMKPLSFQQVLSQFLPLRHKVDRLVGAYFRTKAVAAPFVHRRNFADSISFSRTTRPLLHHFGLRFCSRSLI